MTGAEFTLEGADAFASSLDAAARDLEVMAPEDAGRIVAQRASVGAPKLTGTLARSITAQTAPATVLVGSDLEYAPVQEFGSGAHNITAQPYLIPALENSAAQVLEAYTAEADKVMAQVHGT